MNVVKIIIIMIILFRKSLKNCSASFLFQFSFFFVQRKANFTIEQQKCKGHKKRDRLLISKREFNFKISQRNNKFNLLIQFYDSEQLVV